MTFNDIITSINHKIENSNLERFTLAQIVTELNNTYRDLANKTEVFETTDYMPMIADQLYYTLPNNIYKPTRVVFRGKSIEFKSQEEMDLAIPGWELEETESQLIYLVYNNMSSRLLQPYPMITSPEGVTDTDSVDVTYIGQLSGLSDTTYSYIYIDSATGAKYLGDQPYGTVSNLNEVVTVYGSYLPPLVDIDNLDSEDIHIDEAHINALIYGTAGSLLFIAGRTEDIQKGQNYLRLYGTDESEVYAIRKRGFGGGVRNTSANLNYRTPFNG